MSDLLPDVILPESIDEGGLDCQRREEPNITAEVKDVVPEVIVDEPPEVKPVIDDEDIFKDAPPKAKKPRSQKQMEHLTRAREKALATRRANKVRREKAQEESKEILGNKSNTEKPKKEVSFDKGEDPESSLRTYLTEEQIINLQEKAVENYDKKRKARKEAKHKKAHEETHQAKTYESVAKAIHQPVNPDPDDVWALCFQ